MPAPDLTLSASQKYTTFSVTTAGKTVYVPRGFYCRAKNLDVTNSVSLSDVSNPAGGAPAVGAQTTLFASPAAGRAESVQLFSDTLYYLRANSAPCLVALELLPTPR